MGVTLVIGDDDADALFTLLKREQEEIETEIGRALEWESKPGVQRCKVRTKWQNEAPTDRDRWPAQHETLADMLERFHAAFAPRLKRLDPAEYEETVLEEDEVANSSSSALS